MRVRLRLVLNRTRSSKRIAHNHILILISSTGAAIVVHIPYNVSYDDHLAAYEMVQFYDLTPYALFSLILFISIVTKFSTTTSGYLFIHSSFHLFQ